MLKKSKQRDEILEILSEKNYHPDADELYIEVKKKLPNVGIATIYRNLEQLQRMGKIIKIDMPEGAACYDGNMEKHHHIKCNNCGKLQDVWLDKEIFKVSDINKIIPNYKVMGYAINFQGLCNNCTGDNISVN